MYAAKLVIFINLFIVALLIIRFLFFTQGNSVPCFLSIVSIARLFEIVILPVV